MVEQLEGRLAPASNITVLDFGAGTLDGFLSATDGTITTADGGAGAGTLSRAALQGVGPGIDINISATSLISFNNLSTQLTLQTAAGHTAAFNAGTDAIFADLTDTLAASGGNINFTAGANLTLASLNAAGGGINSPQAPPGPAI